jgi:hypothetical protein
MELLRNTNRTSTKPVHGYRDIEVLYPSGERVCYRMYAEMYERTMEVFLALDTTGPRYKFVVAYLLNWQSDGITCIPEAGKSYINLEQICSIDVIGVDSDRSE